VRSRTAQVDRIDRQLRSLIPCYRDPGTAPGGRRAADGKVYPVGERWEWRRIALRREAIAAILSVEPTASIRVVRDVLERYGHRVSHEQVRTDMAPRTTGPPVLLESRRWLPLESWLDETSRRRAERTGRRTREHRGGAPLRRRPSDLPPDRQPVTSPTHQDPTRQPSAPARGRQDDWAVWDDAARSRRAT